MAGFKVLDTPGHSKGHVSYWRESDRVLILGDVLNNMDVFTGIPGLREPKKMLTPDPARTARRSGSLGELEPLARAVRSRRPAARHREVHGLLRERRSLMARMEVSASGPVAAPAAHVWELLCDTSRYAEWVAATDEVTRTDGPAREGSTYDEVNPILGPWKGSSHWTVTSFDAPNRQAHRGRGIAPTVKWLEVEMAVTPAGRGCVGGHPDPHRRVRAGAARGPDACRPEGTGRAGQPQERGEPGEGRGQGDSDHRYS